MLGGVDEPQNGRTRWGHGCGSGRMGNGEITLSRGKFELDSAVLDHRWNAICQRNFIELRTAKLKS
jgi:hypothetical protein